MASRIMHLIIAKLIEEEFGLNHNRFGIGNLMPDAHNDKNASKRVSHFVIPGKIDYGNRYLDYDRFVYENDLTDDLNLGYMSHLIADDEWLRKIYVPIMLDENEKIIREKQNDYYRDYGKLNQKLIKSYDLKLDYTYVESPFEWICSDRMKEHVDALIGDFSKEYSNDLLKIMDYDEILSYIDSTASLISKYIFDNKLRGR